MLYACKSLCLFEQGNWGFKPQDLKILYFHAKPLGLGDWGSKLFRKLSKNGGLPWYLISAVQVASLDARLRQGHKNEVLPGLFGSAHPVAARSDSSRLVATEVRWVAKCQQSEKRVEAMCRVCFLLSQNMLVMQSCAMKVCFMSVSNHTAADTI